jgi:ABC-type transport system involved in multi-copper enzyme maturation permease subunit
MSKKHRNIGTILELEAAGTYRFPILEVTIGLLVYVVFGSATMVKFTYGLYIGRSSWWNGTEYSQQISNLVNRELSGLIGSIFLGMIHPLAFIVPILVSISVAGSFEDRTLPKLLSYPIRRYSLLAGKLLLVIVVPTAIIIISSLIALNLFVSTTITLYEIIILFFGLLLFVTLLTSFGALVSILTKRISVAAIGGVAFWYSLQLMISTGLFQSPLIFVFNSLGAAAVVLSGQDSFITLTDIPCIFIGSTIVAVTLLIFTFKLFQQVEV